MMRKITFILVAFLVTTMSANALELKNPTTPLWDLTVPIVLWVCATNDFAASNTMEIDETVTLAFDITDTKLLEWIQAAPAGVTRGIGLDVWLAGTDTDADGKHIFMGRVNYRPMTGGSHIYAIDINFAQTANNHGQGPAIKLVQVEGKNVVIRATLLGYGFTQGNADLEWWDDSSGNHIYDEMVILTQPYTGTKKADDFFMDDFDEVLSIGGGYTDIQGLAIHCMAPKIGGETGINVIDIDSPVIGHEYYNLQGVKLSKQPESGLFIEKAMKVDGTSVATKVLKPLK
jgi:hypothetical protein